MIMGIICFLSEINGVNPTRNAALIQILDPLFRLVYTTPFLVILGMVYYWPCHICMYNWHFPSYGAIYLYVGRERERQGLCKLFIDCFIYRLPCVFFVRYGFDFGSIIHFFGRYDGLDVERCWWYIFGSCRFWHVLDCCIVEDEGLPTGKTNISIEHH